MEKSQGIDRLNGWFQSGRLIRPSAEALNFVDLVRAIGHLASAERIQAGPGVKALCDKIGPAKHYVFVLIDGLGMDQLYRLTQESLLRSCMVGQLQAVFLSTTAAALTTLATGEWPCSHSVPGWWTFLEGLDMTAVTLPFIERSSKKPLQKMGLSVSDLFPLPSFWPDLKHKPLSVLPEEIVDSTFSKYASGGTARVGYRDLADAIETACKSVLNASGPTLTYIYVAQLDALSHEKGPEHEAVHKLVLTLDEYLWELVGSLAGCARIVISADHGQAGVPKDHRFLWACDDPILSHLRCPPTGEPNVPIFHVHRGHEAPFLAEFSERFGEHFVLLTPVEMERLRLLGPDGISRVMKERLGSFVGISQRPACIYVGPPEESGSENNGVHGGLTRNEMYVPLVIPE